MEIGPARRVFEVDPLVVPVPEHLPDLEPTPTDQPAEPVPEPASVAIERMAVSG